MRARQQAGLDRDRTDLRRVAAVRALLVDGDALADDRLLELVERELRGLAARSAYSASASSPENFASTSLLDGLRRVLALELVEDLRRLVELAAELALDLRRAGPGRPAAR